MRQHRPTSTHRERILPNWTKWKALASPAGYPGPAVYQTRIVRRQRAVSLRRLLGADSDGILAIGETGAFENRRRQFIRGIATGAGHSEANLIWLLRLRTTAKGLFDGASIEYRFQRANSKTAAGELERAELWRYALRFGEVPPFNSSFPGRHAQIAEHRRKQRRAAS